MRLRAKTTLRSTTSKADRRGTVLLLVVGVVALLAIIVVLYGSIGAADRRQSVVLERTANTDAYHEALAEYFGKVLVDDLFSVSPMIVNKPINERTYAREVWDYPSIDRSFVIGTTTTDPNVDKVLYPAVNDILRFQPHGNGSDPWLASTLPVYDPEAAFIDPKTDPIGYLENIHTWPTITNVSPSGLFVNLHNLMGNFDAESGTETDSDGLPRMSTRLFTLKNLTGTSYGLQTGTTDSELKEPLYWQVNQRFLFRPAVDRSHDPSDWHYLLYQFADADGDGMLDSRWFELIDGTDPESPLTIVPNPRGYRMFAAVRVMDLSALVNVNTATDLAAGPDDAHPAGSSPAEVDLLRLLTQIDSIIDLDENFIWGYEQAEFGSDADYFGIDRDGTIRAGLGAAAANKHALSRRDSMAAEYERTGLVFGPDIYYNTNDDVLMDAPEERWANASTRFDFYRRSEVGLSGLGVIGGALQQINTYTLGDELELLRFWGVNDSETTSRLEAVVGRRSEGFFNGVYSPLRSNRPYALERLGRDYSWISSSQADGKADFDAMLWADTDIRRLLTTVSGARPIVSQPVDDPKLVSAEADRLGLIDTAADALDLLDALRVTADPVREKDGAQRLFTAVFGALAPYAADDDMWSRFDMPDVNTTLHYGYNAELAYRMAAHWVANLRSLADNDGNPDRFGVELVDTAGADTTKYDEVLIRPTDDNDAMLLDPGTAPTVLTPDNTGQVMDAYNVYGIEPQPFITAVASFAFMTDSQSGDEFDPTTPMIFPPVDIDFSPGDAASADYIGEVVVFQVTNPFAEPIVLSDDTSVAYYIEYRGQFFSLQELDSLGGTLSGMTLDPGETINCYTMSTATINSMNLRFEQGARSSAGVPTEPFERWVTEQLKGGGVLTNMDATHIPALDPSGSPLLITQPATGYFDVHNRSGGAGLDGRTVLLWRTAPPATRMGQEQDFLADRLTIPATESDLVLLNSQTIDIDGTTTTGEAGDDDTGYAAVVYTVIARPTWKDTAKDGVVPPYCIEARSDSEPEYAMVALNASVDDQANPSFDKSEFTGGIDGFDTSWESLITDMLVTPLSPELARHPDMRQENKVPDSQSFVFDNTGVLISRDYEASAPLLFEPGRQGFDKDERVIRKADLLLPLAIGPWENPEIDPAAGNRYDQLERRWMTLAEAYALAADYYSPPPTGTLTPGYLYRLGHDDPNMYGTDRFARARIDRGHFVFDAFAPFIDDTSVDGIFEADTDHARAWPWAPLAVNMLERLSVDGLGTHTQLVPGRINVNTAPLRVLRLLPGMTPILPSEWTGVPADDYDWYSKNFYGADSITALPDIASTIVGYRDMTQFIPRDADGTVAGMLTLPMSFRPDEALDGISGRREALSVMGQPLLPVSLSEEPGLRTATEVLLVSNRRDDPTHKHAIDRLAHDDTNIDQDGLAVWPTADDPMNAMDTRDDLADDYAERLALANGVLGTLTNRSDVFAVWFVVHGYQRSDVENLPDGEPMVPSLAKRFIMVVDRSNVTQKGQQPHVLLFEEVPY